MTGKFRLLWLLFQATLMSFVSTEDSAVVELTDANVNKVLTEHDAVVINFFASWCPYSQFFKPEFLEAGKLLREKFNTGETKAVAATIDCVVQSALEERFGVSKYPTVKLSLHGKILENEYRGKREAKSILKYVESYLVDTTIVLNATTDFEQITTNKPAVIAYITRPNNDAHKLMKKVASWMKMSCRVYVTYIGDRLPAGTDLAKDHVFLKEEDKDVAQSAEYTDDITNADNLLEWLKGRCQPTVQELTFENAEELSEPGIPFLVLFRRKDDVNSLQLFKSAVRRELVDFIPSKVRTLIADGNVFVHPLHQAGKSEVDMPIILLDSFVHMYVFKNFQDVETPGKLKRFVEDYKSGKLHQDFHDEEMSKIVNLVADHNEDNDDFDASDEESEDIEHIQITEENTEKTVPTENSEKTLQVEDEPIEIIETRRVTTPPESSFKYLQPSRHRYTFKRDEL